MAMVGAGSVVTKSVPDHGLVFGVPAKLRGFVCKCGFRLAEEKQEGDVVKMKCTECGMVVDIQKKDYDLLKK